MNKTLLVLLSLIGAVFIGLGLVGLINPTLLLNPLMDTALKNPSAINEGRSAYGGQLLSIGVLLLIGVRHDDFRQAAFLMAVVIGGGLSVGRLASIFLDGFPTNPLIWIFFISEPFMAAVGWLGLKQSSNWSKR